MSKENKTTKTVIEEGATIPNMQKANDVPLKKGAPIPQMQPVTQPKTDTQPGTNQGTSGQGSADKNSGNKK